VKNSSFQLERIISFPSSNINETELEGVICELLEAVSRELYKHKAVFSSLFIL
jgi:hypothetical protein